MRSLMVPRISILFLLILISSTTTPPAINTKIYDDAKLQALQGDRYTQHDPIAILNNSDFSRLGFLGSGTYEDPYIIEGLYVENDDRCIWIANTNSFVRIQNCFLLGVALDVSLRLENVTNCVFKDCIIEGTAIGIYLFQCASVDILDSMIVGANGAGIWAEYCDYDIVISNNRIFECIKGIYLENSSDCIIDYNHIYCNFEFGIHLSAGTEFNTIGQNSIGWNGGRINVRNAIDEGNNNNWDGNRWSDYRSDYASYFIPGSAFAFDNDPVLLNDSSAPVIAVSEIDRVVQGNTSAFLSWTIAEEFPISYEMYQNSAIVDEGHLIWDIITYPLGSLSTGIYNFTIVARDAIGNVEILQRSIDVFSPAVERAILFTIGIWACISVILPSDYLRRVRKRKKVEEIEAEHSEDTSFDISKLLE